MVLIFFPFLPIILTSISIEIEKVLYFPILSPKQLDFHYKSFSDCFMIKW